MKEADVAITLGVPRARLRKLREESLQLVTHWNRGHGGQINYTEAGIGHTRGLLADELTAEESREECPPSEDLAVERPIPENGHSDTNETAPATLAEAGGGHSTNLEPNQTPSSSRMARVTRLFRNKRLLEAEIDGTGRRIQVRVKDSSKFHCGFQIPVIMESEHWARLGRKEPRWRGRW